MRSLILLWVCLSFRAVAGESLPGSQPSPRFVGKKVVALKSVQNIQIEMPDRSQHNFGEDYQASLVTRLTQTGRYIVADSLPVDARMLVDMSHGYAWSGSVTPAATVRIEVDALSFSTGSRGERMFYGFDERFRTPFNDGSGRLNNEFPLKTVSDEPSWFGDTFVAKGLSPLDSRSGLDLGDGFQIDLLYAWLSVKYSLYHSNLHLKLYLDTPTGKASSYRQLEVSGDGFFFDVAGAYQGYSAGISVARRDAMEQAMKQALDGSVEVIERALSELPLMAKIDAVLPDQTILMGTGPYSGVKPGVLYSSVEGPELVIETTASVASGSIGRIVSGSASDAKEGVLLQQVESISLARRVQKQLTGLMSVNSVALPSQELPVSGLLPGLVPIISRARAFLLSLEGLLFLPYRVWRYFSYDQAYHKDPDQNSTNNIKFSQEPWVKQIGLDLAPPMEKTAPVVAILDSGMDYNHPLLHDSLWLNPAPQVDADDRLDRYGWDFTSEDSRAYDDGYHGTQVASLIATVAPEAHLMPVKVFNPWGVTSSAAVYAGFTYAVDHGANMIVCAWSTGVNSQAIRMGITYARDHGVLVVAAAGDQGVDLARWKVYPSTLSRSFDNVVTVTGVDENGQIFQEGQRKANYGPASVQIAAPGKNIRVAEPRLGEGVESSTGLAAAIVTGVLARNWAKKSSPHYLELIQELLQDAEPLPGLSNQVRGGLFVKARN